MPKTLVYVASPYTHKKQSVMDERAAEITRIWAAILYNFPQLAAFSPIAASHHVQQYLPANKYLPAGTGVDWYGIDLAFMIHFDWVLVVQQDGWKESYGVNLEIETAQKHKIPVIYTEPEQVLETLENVFGGRRPVERNDGWTTLEHELYERNIVG